jgi:hypothetical protein
MHSMRSSADGHAQHAGSSQTCTESDANLGTAAAQVSLYQKGVQLNGLRVLSTTTTVPQAAAGTCAQGSINGICIGAAPRFACMPACMHAVTLLACLSNTACCSMPRPLD